MLRYLLLIPVLMLLFMLSRAFGFDDSEILTLSPVTSGAPSTAVILPSTGGVPTFQYTQPNGNSVVVSPSRPPTFIYPGKQGAPSVMIQPNGATIYRYESRTK